jgi:galactokinase
VPDGSGALDTEVAAFAPGRVNLIGEHTDYNEGLALPFAITLGITARAQPRRDRRVEVEAVDLGESDEFEIGDAPGEPGGWRSFVRGVLVELGEAGLPLAGARLEIGGDIPRGAGLSSSAALEVAVALAMLGLSDVAPDRMALAQLCSRAENRWAGAQTGLLDQLASLFGEPDAALRIDFRSLEIEPVRLDLDDWRLVTLDSGERHSHADSGYNRRRAECRRAAELMGLSSLRDADPAKLSDLPEPLDRRARHIVEENARVDVAIEALGRGDLEELGRLLDASHASERDLFEVSTDAVEAAVDSLRDAGAAGARLVGGGFGGHVLGLMPPGAQAPARSLEVRLGPGARLLG